MKPTIGQKLYLKHCMTELSSSFDLIESLLCVGTWKFSSIVSQRGISCLCEYVCVIEYLRAGVRACVRWLRYVRGRNFL